MSLTLPKPLLSKSTFVRGCQCTKSLWLNKHAPQLRDEMSDAQESIFTQGNNVGALARELYPNGVNASPFESVDSSLSKDLYDTWVPRTAAYMAAGHKVIYEAAFQHNGVMAAIDILVNKKGKWYAYEVKSSTKVKDTYEKDAALEYYVITNSGIALKDISIVYINNNYIRNGALDIEQLFTKESVLQTAIAMQSFITEKIAECKNVLSLKQTPVKDIGAHCNEPYACDFTGHCWKHIPENSVFDLRGKGGANTAFELYEQGIVKMEDIPADYPIKKSQLVQVKMQRQGAEKINKVEIKKFLNGLQYPLYCVDFETFNNAVPEHNGCWPYQQVPFQFSLHIVNSNNPLDFLKANVLHKCFLAGHGTDPREMFLKTLIDNLGRKGSILVYHKGFENGRLNELARSFPKYAKNIAAIQKRMVDLMTPFQRKHYYTPAMKGSYSIKVVLPALVPDLSYDSLPINNGVSASDAFCHLQFEKDPTKVEEIRKQLLAYCEMDTWAMVRVVERLNLLH